MSFLSRASRTKLRNSDLLMRHQANLQERNTKTRQNESMKKREKGYSSFAFLISRLRAFVILLFTG